MQVEHAGRQHRYPPLGDHPGRQETIALIDMSTELEGGEEPDERAAQCHDEQGRDRTASTSRRFQPPSRPGCLRRIPCGPRNGDARSEALWVGS